MPQEELRYPEGTFLPGTKYRVVRKLGQGGMGVVLEVVKDPGLRSVIKIIHPHLAADPDFRRRFFDEVRILAQLQHPNIVRVTDYDELSDGTPYFAMELLHGSTVREVARASDVMHPGNIFLIMTGLLAGLEYAHTHTPPIIHRDIKSDNIFIHVPSMGDASIKVIDFGVAVGQTAADAKGLFFGTIRYAAPEQIRGQPVTAKADLYAAGILLYELIAGQGPFDSIAMVPGDKGERQRAAVRAHLTLEPPPVRDFAPWVPAVVEDVLKAALAKDPDKRPASANAFASKLFMLQLLAPQTEGNETVRDLVTMAELAAVAIDGRGPAPPPVVDVGGEGRGPGVRAESHRGADDAAPNSRNVTRVAGPVDTEMREGIRPAERSSASPQDGDTVMDDISTLMAGCSSNTVTRLVVHSTPDPVPPEVSTAERPRARSFADAEAERADKVRLAAAHRQALSSTPDPLVRPVMGAAADSSLSSTTQRARREASAAGGRFPFAALIAVLIMMGTVVAAYVAASRLSDRAPAASAALPNHAAPGAAPVKPLPPVDPDTAPRPADSAAH